MEAKDLLEKVVYDLKKSIVGKVIAVHEPGQYISPANKKPVLDTVLELDTGDSFIANEEALKRWTVLAPAEVAFYTTVNQGVTMMVKTLCGEAVRQQITAKLTFLMLGRTLQVQGGVLLKPEGDEPDGWGEG
jgi:hypothetical protein